MSKDPSAISLTRDHTPPENDDNQNPRPRNGQQPGTSLLQGTGLAHGTFGELLQGALPGAENHFLITLPIHRFSRASLTVHPEHTTLCVTPSRKVKAARMAELLLQRLGMPVRGHLHIQSQLVEGKGLASSSADLVATARAIFAARHQSVDEEMMLEVLREIEPTDGVMYPDCVAFFHRQVRLHRRLGSFGRQLHILAVDEGGVVDTVSYNQRCNGYSDPECVAYAKLLDEAGEAFVQGDLSTLGAIATRSSVLNQPRNPKRHFDRMLRLCDESEALGLVATHSGPCLGLLFDDSQDHDRARAQARRELEMQGLETLEFSTLVPESAPDGVRPIDVDSAIVQSYSL